MGHQGCDFPEMPVRVRWRRELRSQAWRHVPAFSADRVRGPSLRPSPGFLRAELPVCGCSDPLQHFGGHVFVGDTRFGLPAVCPGQIVIFRLLRACGWLSCEQGRLFTFASSPVHLVEGRAWWRPSRESFTEEVAAMIQLCLVPVLILKYCNCYGYFLECFVLLKGNVHSWIF